MGELRKGWYEREEIKRVTMDWADLNCNLTEREFELLEIVYERKLVRRDSLEIISKSYRNIGKNRTNSINRAISKMFRSICLDKVHQPRKNGESNMPCIVGVDKAGSLLLGVKHSERIIQNTTKKNGILYTHRSLPSNFKHINGVNKLETETILFCERYDSNIIRWDLEEKNIKLFYHNQEKIILIPDVFMILEIDGKNLVAFIEYDTGSENVRYKIPPIIREKLIKYKKYKSSGLWLKESWQDLLSEKQFPLILFITEDDKRVNIFNQKSKDIGVQGLGIYYKNYNKILEKISTLLK